MTNYDSKINRLINFQNGKENASHVPYLVLKYQFKSNQKHVYLQRE